MVRDPDPAPDLDAAMSGEHEQQVRAAIDGLCFPAQQYETLAFAADRGGTAPEVLETLSALPTRFFTSADDVVASSALDPAGGPGRSPGPELLYGWPVLHVVHDAYGVWHLLPSAPADPPSGDAHRRGPVVVAAAGGDGRHPRGARGDAAGLGRGPGPSGPALAAPTRLSRHLHAELDAAPTVMVIDLVQVSCCHRSGRDALAVARERVRVAGVALHLVDPGGVAARDGFSVGNYRAVAGAAWRATSRSTERYDERCASGPPSAGVLSDAPVG